MASQDRQQNYGDIYWVKANRFAGDFPKPSDTVNDLLAIGGDLSVSCLLTAYQRGIFPWFNEGQPILWWCPNPRCVLSPETIKISRSLAKRVRQRPFSIRYNTAFSAVLEGCAAARKDTTETWLTESMQHAYLTLFKQGYAHSVECWHNEQLVGGLYGVAMGRVFFGESMFSRANDASKLALVALAEQLVKRSFKLIDCQVPSKHLSSLGATLMARDKFLNLLAHHCSLDRVRDWE